MFLMTFYTMITLLLYYLELIIDFLTLITYFISFKFIKLFTYINLCYKLFTYINLCYKLFIRIKGPLIHYKTRLSTTSSNNKIIKICILIP